MKPGGYQKQGLRLLVALIATVSFNAFGLEILTIGDSITQGFQRRADNSVFGITRPVNGAADVGGYQSRVNDKLNAVNMPSTLYNWGVGGENSSRGASRIGSVLNTRSDADYILIMYGANDLYQGISASANKANLRSMINQSRARGVEPIIGEITPNNLFRTTIPAAYNPNIIALAGETNTSLAHMHTLLFPGWNSVPYNSGDGLHLSNAGYERMADIWFDILISKNPTPPTPPENPFPGTGIFIDVPDDYFGKDAIETIYQAGITGGCKLDPLLYCFDSPVTRAQMAVFIGRAMHGQGFTPASPTGRFGDVPASYWAADWIEQFSNDGITTGCGNGNFCPDAGVTRAQMAIFLERAIRGRNYKPPAATGRFSDVPVSNPFSPWIEQLAKDAVTGGCGNGEYCPGDVVSRGEMAVFLVRAFTL